MNPSDETRDLPDKSQQPTACTGRALPASVRRYRSLFERLVANTRVDDDGCWIWTGRTNGRYPVFTERQPGKAHPVKRYAHRAMLEEVTGWLFPFDEAGHYRCFKPLCIKPGCLRIETQAENLATRRSNPAGDVGCWIPTLFPTERRLTIEAIDAHLEACDSAPGRPAGAQCPF